MRALAGLAIRDLGRTPSRSVVRILVLALAVALLGSMLVFVNHSLRIMTASATRSVPISWQGPVSSYGSATSIASRVAREPGIAAAAPVATAPFAGADHLAPTGLVQTGRGAILALPSGYTRAFPTLRFLQGSLRNGQVVLDQQLAATLQASVGSRISVTPRAGAPALSFVVSGIALVSNPDVLFAPLDPQLGPAAAQPPAEIMVMPIGTFAQRVAPVLGTITQAGIGSSAVPGAQQGTQWQVQAKVDAAALHGDPAAALTQATQIRNRVERDLLGQVRFVDNLGDNLSRAAGDALYAETLYVMLAVPGALIALGLAYLAALGTAERDRKELSLLRGRGATRRNLIGLALVESAVLGLIAGLIGTVGAILAVRTLVPGTLGLGTLGVATVALVCVVLATAGALAARLGASAGALRGEIAAGRQGPGRAHTPLWQRLYLDVAALCVSGAIYWLTIQTGFSAVVNPDSNPTLSLSVYMFFAPALLWIGVALLLVRLRGRAVAMVAGRTSRSAQGRLSGFLLASASRRGAAINRGLVLVGLLLAFGVQLGVFAATYTQQANVDAQLTVGADVAVTSPDGTAGHLATQVATLPGVAHTTALQHDYAYVGPDLQDIYGIDAHTLPRATTLRDSYFVGISAGQAMQRLASTPDGLLVSKETIKDYSLHLGDLVRLRVLNRTTGHFQVAQFHVLGAVQEFPSAPKDSFMVANLAYLQQVTASPGPNVVFASTNGDPAVVGARVAAATANQGAHVRTIREQTQQTTSSITTVDLTGISRIEEVFALILAAAAMGLYVHLALEERRREFATMAALGTSRRDIVAFVWSEAALVLGAAMVVALGLGLLLAAMLTAMLQHVFDPPPDSLAVPWPFILGLFGVALAASAIATLIALQRVRRLPLGVLLRE